MNGRPEPAPQTAAHGVIETGAPEALVDTTTTVQLPRRKTRLLSGTLRILYAYWVTFVVALSYLSLRIQSWLRSPETIERLSEQKHRRNAQRIEGAILRLQGLFIKVGQLISVMTNFLPEAFRRELEGLQDQVPPHPFADIDVRFRDEFGGNGPYDAFAEFDEQPVAAASIGQVHIARMHSGLRVAVKVQYPDIDEIVRADLKTLRRIFQVTSYLLPYQGLDTVYREIREMVLAELDFKKEADNIERISTHFRGRRGARFPRVIRELTTARVLTTEWIDGIKVSDRERLDRAGLDRRALARQVIHAYCQQIFTDGFYHADPHPGNLLVTPGPEIVFIDFGAVGQVSQAMREGMVEFLQGVFSRDSRKIVEGMKRMGFIAKGADPAVFDRIVEFFHERIQEQIHLDSFSLKDVKFDPQKSLEDLADLRKLDVKLRDMTDNFHVPKEWILLERALLLLLGLCTELDPEMNPMTVIQPYLEAFVLGKDRDWSAFALEAGKDMMLNALTLPGEVRKFLAATGRGELQMQFRNLDDNVRILYTLGHQLIYALGGITSAAFWLVLDGRAQQEAAATAALLAWGFGVLLGGSILVTRNRVKKRRH